MNTIQANQASINTITTDVHGTTLRSKIIRDLLVDRMSYVEFIDECYCMNLSYAEYVVAAQHCGKRVVSTDVYKSYFDSCDCIAVEFAGMR